MSRSTDNGKSESDFVREMIGDAEVSADELAAITQSLPPVPPSNELFSRIEATAQSEGRFHRFTDHVADLADVDGERARDLLDGLDAPDSWEAGPIPGMRLYHIDGGPRVANAIAGFVRLEGATEFPEHRHLGDERVLVIQGRFVDTASGQEAGPGDVVELPGGSTHGFRVLDGPDLVYLAIVQEGLEMLGQKFGPSDL